MDEIYIETYRIYRSFIVQYESRYHNGAFRHHASVDNLIDDTLPDILNINEEGVKYLGQKFYDHFRHEPNSIDDGKKKLKIIKKLHLLIFGYIPDLSLIDDVPTKTLKDEIVALRSEVRQLTQHILDQPDGLLYFEYMKSAYTRTKFSSLPKSDDNNGGDKSDGK